MLGLDRATIRKLDTNGSIKGVRLKSSLCEVFHENTKLTPLSGRASGQVSAAFLASEVAQKLSSEPYKVYSLMDQVELPAVTPAGGLQEAIVHRRSQRRYSGEPATVGELASLLYLTYGRSDPRGHFRPIASGGGLYPLELYVAAFNVDGLEPGLYHYAVENHRLDAIRRGEVFDELEEILWLQDIEEPRKASMVLFVSAILLRSTLKYGDRGYRLVLMEAGEAVHNLALVAGSLGLACCPLGGFLDNALSDYLGIDGIDEVPLVPLVVGRPSPPPAGAREPRAGRRRRNGDG